jgi:hypothetical protein
MSIMPLYRLKNKNFVNQYTEDKKLFIPLLHIKKRHR